MFNRRILELPFYLPAVQAFRRLTGSLKCAFLDSSLSNNLGRYSIIGIQPYLKLVKNADGFFVNDQPETELSFEDYLRRYLAEHVDQNDTDLPLVSGAIGYFSYDYVKYSNPKLKLDAKDEEGFKDVDVMLFDKVIAFDNVKQKIIIMVTVKTDELEKNYETAVQTIKKIAKMIIRGEMKKEWPGCLKTEFKPLFQKDEYCRMVEIAKEYIYHGDIFQVVLS